MPSGYPRITESPTLKAVEKDRNTVMLCSAVGNPDPIIMWLKDFIPVDLTDPRLKLLQTGKPQLPQSEDDQALNLIKNFNLRFRILVWLLHCVLNFVIKAGITSMKFGVLSINLGFRP